MKKINLQGENIMLGLKCKNEWGGNVSWSMIQY